MIEFLLGFIGAMCGLFIAVYFLDWTPENDKQKRKRKQED